MFLQISSIILILVLFATISKYSDARALCYSGSSIYQLLIQDCTAQNPSYNGTWYCAKMEVIDNTNRNNKSHT